MKTTKQTKEQKRLRKIYNKMNRNYRTKLTKQAREYAPWSWSYMFNMLRTTIEYQYEYYKLGYNVWQSEETRQEVINSLQKCIDIFYQLDNIDYFRPTTNDVIIDKDNKIVWNLTEAERQDYAELNAVLDRNEQLLYTQLFDTIKEHFQSWLD